MIEEAVQTLLTAVSPRTYGFKLPENSTLPAVTFMKVSAPRDQTQEGPSGLVSARFQVVAWGKNYTASKRLSKDVRFALDGYNHRNEYIQGVRIDGIELMNEIDGNEAEPNVFQTIMDFRIKYAEERPSD